MSALGSPAPSGLLTQWSLQPLALLACALLALWYVRSIRRLTRAGTRWPLRRSVVFGTGLATVGWTTNGFAQAYASSLYWVWTAQTLVLLLIAPLLLLTGRPLQLARAAGAERTVERVLTSRPARVLANPLVGPALVPLLSAVLFFGPLPGWAIEVAPAGWLLQLALVAIGALITLPFVGWDEEPSSLAVGLSLAIGSFELVLDAIPGIVLRLHSTVATTYFAHRSARPWSPSALDDQRVAGSILWCVSEVIDLPFLLLVFRRWLRADARDAAQVDAVLEAERFARSALDDESPPRSSEGPADTPWWLSDPTLQRRMRRRD